MAIATGPAIRAVCRVLNRNSCGSGSICGIEDGHSLIMTNYHVAGGVGNNVIVQVESQGMERLEAKVVEAAYSNQVSADWSLLKTKLPYSKVKPVKFFKGSPTGGHYTKGFPRCQPHGGTDINLVRINGSVAFWRESAIGGQSGSAVWNDKVERAEMLLTWQWSGYGAGQTSQSIYGQMSTRTLVGTPKPPGLIELNDYDWGDIDRDTLPERGPLEEGYFTEPGEVGIRDRPIWWTAPDEPVPPPPGEDRFGAKQMIEYLRGLEEYSEKWRTMLESQEDANGGGDGGGNGNSGGNGGTTDDGTIPFN